MLNVPFPRFGAAAVPLQFLLLDQVLAHRFSSFKRFLGFAFQRLLDLQFLNPCCIALLQVLGCCQWGGRCNFVVRRRLNVGIVLYFQPTFDHWIVVADMSSCATSCSMLDPEVCRIWLTSSPRSTVHRPQSAVRSRVRCPGSAIQMAAELPEAVVQDFEEFVEEHLAPAPGAGGGGEAEPADAGPAGQARGAAHPGLLRPIDPASAEYANSVLRCGIRISPGVIGLTSETIVEHYGCLGPDYQPLTSVFLQWICCYCFLLRRMHLRHIETAPTFMRQEYDTAQEWSWAFGGFNFPRASFYPEGRRTGEAVGQLCGSSLACLSSKGSFWQMILGRVPAFIFLELVLALSQASPVLMKMWWLKRSLWLRSCLTVIGSSKSCTAFLGSMKFGKLLVLRTACCCLFLFAWPAPHCFCSCCQYSFAEASS